MFDADLADGRSVEEKVRTVIEDKTGYMCYRAPDGEFKGYDLRLDLRDMKDHPYFERRYEVKHDRGALRTGNVVVELTCRGKPSGIVASTSDYWVFVVGQTAHFIEVAVLRFEVFCSPYARIQGGDGNASVIILLPMTRLKELAKSIVTIP